MFCILDYRYYSHCLNIFPCNSTDYELFDKFGHHHYQILFAHAANCLIKVWFILIFQWHHFLFFTVIISVVCSHRSLQNSFKEFLPVWKSCLLLFLSNKQCVNNQQAHTFCLFVFDVNDFVRLLYHVRMFLTVIWCLHR